ncbi:MAG: DNA-binding protein [Chloroflexi bacterium]|nr:DNA-binding protein [Chloroflexota bacterium]
MRRTSILVDPLVMTELEQLARRDRRPTAHLIREAMERYVTERRDDVSEPRELPAFVGIGHGPGDVANRAEEILEVELPTHLDPR